MKAKNLIRTFCLSLVFGFAVFSTGCKTTDPFDLKIEDDLALAPAFPEKQKYTLVYGNSLSRELIEPYRHQLHRTLEKLGYETAQPSDANLVIYVGLAKDQLASLTRQLTVRDAVGAMNPDSIRFKNIAAMQQYGRYKELLMDDPGDPGELIIGPSGEIIYTGELKQRQFERDLPMVTEVYRVNNLVVSALETPISTDLEKLKIAWKVKVVSELPIEREPPTPQVLIEAALNRLISQHPEPPST